MNLAIMQPYVFPYIGYYQLVFAVDKFVFFDDVNFINKGWVNRNKILINNDEKLFTIPLENASQNRMINEIQISPGNAIEKILRSIEVAYKKSPNFPRVFPVIQNVFNESGPFISDIAKASIKQVFSFLELKKNFIDSSGIYENKHLKGQERIIDISLREDATGYTNLSGGIELYNRNKFEINKIKLQFIKSKEIKYKQWGEQFTPFLSIIDILMFNSPEDIRLFLGHYQLL